MKYKYIYIAEPFLWSWYSFIWSKNLQPFTEPKVLLQCL